MSKAKGQRHTALLVEDEERTAQGLRELLESLGHDCVHVTNQTDGMAVFEKGVEICYVLLDLQIKVKPNSLKPIVEAGHNLLRFIRQHYPVKTAGGCHQLPVLVMSGHAKDTPDVVEAMKLGGDEFSVKPFKDNPIPLSEKIRAALHQTGRVDHQQCERASALGRGESEDRAGTLGSTSAAFEGWVLETGRKERRILDVAEYQALRADASNQHLFLDLFDLVTPRSVRGGYRPPSRPYRKVEVPIRQAFAVAEVMAAQSGLRERDFHVESTRGKRTFQEGRQKLDQRLPSGQWRSLKTVVSDHPSETRYVFRPEPEVRYLLLHNLPADRTEKHG